MTSVSQLKQNSWGEEIDSIDCECAERRCYALRRDKQSQAIIFEKLSDGAMFFSVVQEDLSWIRQQKYIVELLKC